MAESRAERKARRALIEAAEGSEEKKSSQKSKSSQDAKGKSAKGKAKAKRPGSRRSEDKASQTRSKLVLHLTKVYDSGRYTNHFT